MASTRAKTRRLFSSLHESLLAAVLVAIVTNLTVPSVSAMLREAATSREAYELAAALGAAREAAIARNARVAVCGLAAPAARRCGPAHGRWQHGWMVYAPATGEALQVKRYSRADLGIRTNLAAEGLSFLPDGSAVVKGESRFVVAVDGDPARGREIVVSGMGRARVVATPRA